MFVDYRNLYVQIKSQMRKAIYWKFKHRPLVELGVRRISVGSALTRAAYGAFLRAAREMQEHGTFTFAADAVSYQEISALLKAS